MNVFLTGATGYIGGAIADALQRTGYRVLGLAHSEKSAQVLQERSISLLRGDLRDPASLARGARQADAVIHAATINSSDMAEADIAAVEAILEALEGTNKPFIYTSGCWVLGNSGESIADEESPTDPNHCPMVQVDDLADAYVRAITQAPAGTLVDVPGGPAVRFKDIARAICQAAGLDGRTESWSLEDARQVLVSLVDALALDLQVSGARAHRLLGWAPHAPSVLDDLVHGSYHAAMPSTL